uniref:Uncharacterized protein n=1 Tax=Picea sitchensis TaxID=3332 RepID=A9NPE0_PICSI|nr:unknown [Picea sitchensis]
MSWRSLLGNAKFFAHPKIHGIHNPQKKTWMMQITFFIGHLM